MNSICKLSVLLIFSMSLPIWAAEDPEHTQNTGQPQTSTGNESSGRANNQARISDRELKFLSEHFYMSQVTLWNKYAEKLPLALEKGMKGDESEVTPIIADLMGLLNDKQTEKVVEDAKKERDAEKEKKPEGGDEKYIALMERLIWGSKMALKDPSKEEGAQKYNKEFEKASKEVAERNKEILEKISQAADGNAKAKEWLRNTLDPRSVLSFAEGQKKFGNAKLADKLVDAMSFNQGKNKFLDMSLTNETQRLHLGTSRESVSQTLDGLISSRGGFQGATVSLNSFSNPPMKQWFVDSSGKFNPGSPSNFEYVLNTPKPGEPAKPNTGGGSNTTPSTPSQPVRQNNAAALAGMINSRCNSCHSSPVSVTPSGSLQKDGQILSLAKVLKAFDSNGMQDIKDKDTVKAQLSQWLAGQ